VDWYESGPGTPPMFTGVSDTGLQGTCAVPNYLSSEISFPNAQDNTGGDTRYLLPKQKREAR
jgi:hypothetical protein